MRSLFLRAIALVLLLCARTSAQTVLFSDGFENGLSHWSATGLWHIEADSDTCGSLVAPFPEGSHCAYYGIAGQCNYDTSGTNSGALTLLTPIVLPAAGPAASLYCWTRHETENCVTGQGWDDFNIEVSINGGSSWIIVGQRCFNYDGPPGGWHGRGMDLTPYLGQSILVRFTFDTVDSFWNDTLGALVDKVEVRQEAGTTFCFNACPCSAPYNSAPMGYGLISGCTSSQARNGELAAGGTPSVAQDSVVLGASALVTPSVALFLQSDGQFGGALAGDGRNCLTGAIVRLGVRAAPNGTASLPGPGDPALSVLGGIPATGGTRYYEVLYRDPTNWCNPATFNYTNGFRITWTP